MFVWSKLEGSQDWSYVNVQGQSEVNIQVISYPASAMTVKDANKWCNF